ncbi:MAG TPA: sodium/proline symporter [candidate division WOR-3 bacterium]|uniref:Sodium/proline symporter n=1 Tax=candidate division WOR-3 bacterium TaxID=2052148 RepID=A0A9C9EM66_UNCW3|nr:sodium/proline symporter [candidate division WOR-3 bacterium]
MSTILLVFLLYLVGMIIVGLITARLASKSLDDFILGGRKMWTPVIALSEKGTDMSAWLLIGLPGQAFKMGLGAIWAGIGVWLGSMFNWLVIATPLRRLAGKYNALTLPDYFESRFNDESHLLRITSSVLIVFFFTLYVSAQVVGAGKILAATFNIHQVVGMVIGLSIILFYTMMGGFIAESWTDFFQGLIMAVAIVVLCILGVVAAGGLGNIMLHIKGIDPEAAIVSAGKSGTALWLGLILGGLAIGFGYAGQPHIVMRYMALQDVKEVKKATIIAMTWTTITVAGAIFLGFIAIPFLRGEITDPEHVTLAFAAKILPGWLVGFVLAAATAAMMSTVDSQLLVAASAVTEDIYRKLINPDASQKYLVKLARIFTVVISVVAFILGLFAKQLVYWLVLYAWGGLAATFGPPLILSLLWKRTTKIGAFVGMVVGAVTIVVWYNVPALKNFLYELIPGFILSFLATWLVSFFTQKSNIRSELSSDAG